MLLSEITVYHGSEAAPKGKFKMPLFLTPNKNGASWYAREHAGAGRTGVLVTGELNVKKPLEAYGYGLWKKMLDVAQYAGIRFKNDPYFQCDEISDAGHSGSNIGDLVYLPKFQQELKRQGYDSVHMSDELVGSSIEVYVIFKPSQFKITSIGDPISTDDAWK
jgi:hypothetical protein